MSGDSYQIIGNSNIIANWLVILRPAVPNDLRLQFGLDGLYTYPNVLVICEPGSPTTGATLS